MSETKHPSEIAREALKQLAARKLAPTPINFQACYNEIAQLPNVMPFPEPPLRQLAGALQARGDEQARQLQLLDAAISRRSWQGVQDALVAYCNTNHHDTANHHETAVAKPVAAEGLPAFFPALLANMVESVLPAIIGPDSETPHFAADLLQTLRDPSVDLSKLQLSLRNFSHHVSFSAEEQAEIRTALLNLLQLIIENIGQLGLDESWLKGQTDALLTAVAPPISLRRLDDVERRLRDVIFKQGEARARSIEAQEEMRQMLASFIERLAGINQSSSDFQGKIEASAREIAAVTSVEDLAPLLQQVIDATHAMADETSRSRRELTSLQEKVLATQTELVQLHLELDNASAMARHDPLTDALNRKGLDEALRREIAGVQRKDSPLSICLLDVDNFKTINDRLGHHTGDEALKHLAGITRRCMRQVDTLARFGGEEFVILMPDTPLEQGMEAMKRLQRELTRNLFLAGNEKLLITFSAGVAQLAPDESGEDAIRRADGAMYLAKRAGKNRVMAG